MDDITHLPEVSDSPRPPTSEIEEVSSLETGAIIQFIERGVVEEDSEQFSTPSHDLDPTELPLTMDDEITHLAEVDNSPRRPTSEIEAASSLEMDDIVRLIEEDSEQFFAPTHDLDPTEIHMTMNVMPHLPEVGDSSWRPVATSEIEEVPVSNSETQSRDLDPELEMTLVPSEIEEVPETRDTATESRQSVEEGSPSNTREQARVPTVEEVYMAVEVPSWWDQITVRCLLTSLVISACLSFISLKMNLSVGMVPSFNVPVGLFGYWLVKLWISASNKLGIRQRPFTRQESAVMQTCIMTSISICSSGGLATYLLAMTAPIAKQVGEDSTAAYVKELTVPIIMLFLCMISLVALPVVQVLRKLMIMNYKLKYPSGTIVAETINTVHTPSGAKLTKKQIKILWISFFISIAWEGIKWPFTGGKQCGFAHLPIFGRKAYKQRFYFDFSPSYIGVGMICPYSSNISLLLGAITSWIILWPFIAKKKGHWYDENLDDNSFHGLQAYKIFIPIAIVLAAGLFQCALVLYQAIHQLANDFYKKYLKTASSDIPRSVRHPPPDASSALTFDDRRRMQYFSEDPISTWVAIGLYIILVAVSIFLLRFTFMRIRWYYLLSLYAFAPILGFCNAYGSGLTDWSLAMTYGRLVIYIIAAWAGALRGGVIVGLASCGVVSGIISSPADLMQDHKTGYLTLASPRSMLIGQVIGVVMGCIISPFVFLLFSKTIPDLGAIDSSYPAPNAVVYRNMAIIGVHGTKALPKHCIDFCIFFFIMSMATTALREFGQRRGKSWVKYIPIPITFAIPFYIGGSFAVSACIGSLVMFLWKRRNKTSAEKYYGAVASGMLCGGSLWTVPSSIIASIGWKPPMCMRG